MPRQLRITIRAYEEALRPPCNRANHPRNSSRFLADIETMIRSSMEEVRRSLDSVDRRMNGMQTSVGIISEHVFRKKVAAEFGKYASKPLLCHSLFDVMRVVFHFDHRENLYQT